MVPVPSSETAGISVSIHAGGAKWPRLTHVSCPTLHVSELVDCRFKIKQGFRGTSATVVVLYMMAGFSHVDFRHSREYICAISCAIFPRIILREREEFRCCELVQQRFDLIGLYTAFTKPLFLHVRFAVVLHPPITMNCYAVCGTISVARSSFQLDGQRFDIRVRQRSQVEARVGWPS